MPQSHRQAGEWSPERLANWAAKTGAATEKLILNVLSSRKHLKACDSMRCLVSDSDWRHEHFRGLA